MCWNLRPVCRWEKTAHIEAQIIVLPFERLTLFFFFFIYCSMLSQELSKPGNQLLSDILRGKLDFEIPANGCAYEPIV